VLKKNYLLFCWKNIHEWRRLVSHFFFAWAGAVLAVMFGDIPLRPNFGALWRAFRQLPQAVRSRRRALTLAGEPALEFFARLQRTAAHNQGIGVEGVHHFIEEESQGVGLHAKDVDAHR